MKRHWMILSAVPMIATACLSGGCESQPAEPSDQAGMARARPVEVLDQTRGSDPALKQPMVRLIRDEQALRRLGAGQLRRMDVNLKRSDLVLVALGKQPTAGYTVRIQGLQQQGDDLYVTGYASAPAEDAMVDERITYPYAAAVIRNTEATTLLSDINAPRSQDTGSASDQPSRSENPQDEESPGHAPDAETPSATQPSEPAPQPEPRGNAGS